LNPLVLIVDDVADIRDLLESLLKDEGFRALTAENGKEALEILEQHRPDVMLLDLIMPVMSGWEVLEQVARTDLSTKTRIIAMSASAEPTSLPPGVRFLRKPMDIGELLALIKTTSTNP